MLAARGDVSGAAYCPISTAVQEYWNADAERFGRVVRWLLRWRCQPLRLLGGREPLRCVRRLPGPSKRDTLRTKRGRCRAGRQVRRADTKTVGGTTSSPGTLRRYRVSNSAMVIADASQPCSPSQSVTSVRSSG